MQKYTEKHRLSPGRCFFAFGNSQRYSFLVHGENTVKYCSSGAVLLRAAYGYYKSEERAVSGNETDSQARGVCQGYSI